MPSLTEHLRRPADHGRLAFHPGCPVCREERLAGTLPADALVGRSTQALLAAGVLVLSTAAPATTLASEPGQEGAAAPDPIIADEHEHESPVDAPATDPEWREEPDTEPPAPENEQPADDVLPAPDAEEPAEEVAPVPEAVEEETAPAPEATPPAPAPEAVPPPAVSEPPAQAAPPVNARVAATPMGVIVKGPPLKSVIQKPSRESDAGPAPAPAPAPPATSSAVLVTAESVESDVVAPRKASRARSGDRTHVVASGESLWSIAGDLLGDGASVARTAREVNRLWELNRSRIATGDPDLIVAGTKLALR